MARPRKRSKVGEPKPTAAEQLELLDGSQSTEREEPLVPPVAAKRAGCSKEAVDGGVGVRSSARQAGPALEAERGPGEGERGDTRVAGPVYVDVAQTWNPSVGLSHTEQTTQPVAFNAASSSTSWDELEERDQQYLVSTVVRFLLANECSRIPVSRRDIAVLLAETIGVQPGPSGRYPASFNSLRNKTLEYAARFLLFDLGFRVLQMGRLPLGEHSRSRARSASRGLTLKMAPYHFYQEKGLIEAEPPAEEADNTNDAMPKDLLLLVSDLPGSLRAEPRNVAFTGFLTILAGLFGLSETGMIGERSLFMMLTGLGFQGLRLSATPADTATAAEHSEYVSVGAPSTPTRMPPEESVPDAGAPVLEGSNWFLRHPYRGDIQKLLTHHLPKMLYLQRFRRNVGDSEWTYAAGPRLRAELPPEALFRFLCEFFGDDADESARMDLERRLLPHGAAAYPDAARTRERARASAA